MFKAIVRTGAALGTLYAIGYIAKKYYGMTPESLFHKTKSTAKDLNATPAETADSKAV